MNSPWVYCKDAVPRRTYLPPEVIGLIAPCLLPLRAVVNLYFPLPVTGRNEVPGLNIPVIGLPNLEEGLIILFGLPCIEVNGLWKEVPGRATYAVVFSSRRISPTPSSSISKSSIYCNKRN